MLLYFFVEFAHTDKVLTCSAYSYSDIADEKECRHAVIYATSLNSNAKYKGSGSWEFNPKGCYMYDNGYMYFNSHPTGSYKSITQNICKKGNFV